MKKGELIFMSVIALALLLFSLAAVAPATDSVPVENEETDVLKIQVYLLEKALKPQDPAAAAGAWAEGVKTRNGAWQYAVLSPELKEEYYEKFAEINWTTGTSS